MFYTLYAIKDVKAGQFMNIWTESTDETAKRNFNTIRTDEKTIFGMYPGDFELWALGTYNRKTGEIISEPRFIEGGAPIGVFQQDIISKDRT